MWHVYLLECADGTLYCGITADLERRVRQHNGLVSGGARYTSGRRPVRLLASVERTTRSDALRLEDSLKRVPRKKKLAWLHAAASAEPGTEA